MEGVIGKRIFLLLAFPLTALFATISQSAPISTGKLRCGKRGPFDFAEEYRRSYKGKHVEPTCPH